MNKIDSFVVKQSRGVDTVVDVFEDTEDRVFYTKKLLIFKTDQSLTTTSERAWDTGEAIEEYARQRGYYPGDKAKNTYVTVFDADTFSICECNRLVSDIENDQRYLAVKTVSDNTAKEIEENYGHKIAILKKAIKILDHSARAEFIELEKHLSDIKNQIIDDTEIPDIIKDEHIARIRRQNKVYTLDQYRQYSVNVPDDLFDLL